MIDLKKHIHDSANGLDYTLVNDHYLPNLTVAAPAEHPTGRWGRLHKMYLKEQHPIRYNQLLLSGELGGYLAKLDKQTEEQLALTIRQMQEAEGVTEALKAADQLEWVLFFKAEGAVNLVDGDQGDGCDHQIEHHGVEGKHHANEHQNAHDRSNNACFHRFDLLCSSGSSPLQGNAFRPEEVPGLSGLHLRCRVCNTDRLPLRCRRTGGCGG